MHITVHTIQYTLQNQNVYLWERSQFILLIFRGTDNNLEQLQTIYNSTSTISYRIRAYLIWSEITRAGRMKTRKRTDMR